MSRSSCSSADSGFLSEAAVEPPPAPVRSGSTVSRVTFRCDDDCLGQPGGAPQPEEPCPAAGAQRNEQLHRDMAALLQRQRDVLLRQIDRCMEQQGRLLTRLLQQPEPDCGSRASGQEPPTDVHKTSLGSQSQQQPALPPAEEDGPSPGVAVTRPRSLLEEAPELGQEMLESQSSGQDYAASLRPSRSRSSAGQGTASWTGRRKSYYGRNMQSVSFGTSSAAMGSGGGRLSERDYARRLEALATSAKKEQEDTVRSGEQRQRQAARAAAMNLPCVLRGWLKAIIARNEFELAISAAIMVNVVLVGVEVDYMATHEDAHLQGMFTWIDRSFTMLFLCELIARLVAQGSGFCCSTNNVCYNLFDAFLVLSSVMEMIMQLAFSSTDLQIGHMRMFRVLRITRLIRTFRMFRLVRFIRALRTLLYSIVVTLKSLVWALLLMFMIFYGFGVAFTQAATDFLGDPALLGAGECQAPGLQDYWGTLPRSMFTLFKSISGGLSWHDAVLPLSSVGWVWVSLFIVFVAFTIFAVLNVVTGVFCQSAIESAQQDKDLATMQLLANKTTYVHSVRTLFSEIDLDQSGVITIQEFEDFLHNETFQASFAALDIDPSDPWTLFKLLDADETGCVDLKKFVTGCVQLKGQAKAIHMAKMAYDNRLVRQMMEEFMDNVEGRFETLFRWAGLGEGGAPAGRGGEADELFVGRTSTAGRNSNRWRSLRKGLSRGASMEFSSSNGLLGIAREPGETLPTMADALPDLDGEGGG